MLNDKMTLDYIIISAKWQINGLYQRNDMKACLLTTKEL